MQNEIIKVVAVSVVRNVASFFAKLNIFDLMMDETTDSTKDQATIIICWITENFKVSEEFLV